MNSLLMSESKVQPAGFHEKTERLWEKSIGKNVIAETPVVSVVITAYNVSEFIGEAVDSVRSQTYDRIEIILVNDGSTDEPELNRALAPHFDDIIYIKQENAGAGAARNAAIEASRGRLIAFLDGDDSWLPEYLESQIDFLESSGLDAIYCDAEMTDNPLNKGLTYMHLNPADAEVTVESLIRFESSPILSGTIVKRETFDRCGVFDEDIRRGQDFDLWLRMALYGAAIGYQTKVLLKHRYRLNSLSGSNIQGAQRTVDILERVEAKYEFNEGENRALEETLRDAKSRLSLEVGKSHLVKANYSAAIESFRDANRHVPSFRNSIIVWFLRLSPGLFVKVFRTFRSQDFDFILSEEKPRQNG